MFVYQVTISYQRPGVGVTHKSEYVVRSLDIDGAALRALTAFNTACGYDRPEVVALDTARIAGVYID